MNFLFYFFAGALVFLSYKSLRGGIDYLNFFKRELARPESSYMPFASVIAPCRGLDEGFEDNLNALFKQNYSRYEILFVVDAETDEAVSAITNLLSRRNVAAAALGIEVAQQTENFSSSPAIAEITVPARIIVAGTAEGESQKVHNLREAVTRVSEKSELLVFVDSDVRPSENWLRALAAPLADEKIGAATGYRWFISKKFGFASEMRGVWNASVASALGPTSKSNFCWGGSMAMRRGVFEKIGMRERWRGALSDDFALTRALKTEALPIYFVPQALTATVESCSWRELFEFTTRQMKITRVYAPHLWKQSLIGAGIFNLVWIWGLWILISHPMNSFVFGFAIAALLLISVFSVGKSWLRLKAVELVLKDYETDLKKQFWTQNTLWIVSPALFFYNAVAALFSRKIVWRGIRYEMISATETVINKENTTNKPAVSSDFSD